MVVLNLSSFFLCIFYLGFTLYPLTPCVNINESIIPELGIFKKKSSHCSLLLMPIFKPIDEAIEYGFVYDLLSPYLSSVFFLEFSLSLFLFASFPISLAPRPCYTTVFTSTGYSPQSVCSVV